MKNFKLVDLIMQPLLVLLSISATLLLPEHFIFIYGYFLVGGWQLFSCLIHYFGPDGRVAFTSRVHYLVFLKWTFITGLLILLLLAVTPSLLLFYLYALLFISPVMAVWYFVICMNEWETLKKRELIHLK